MTLWRFSRCIWWSEAAAAGKAMNGPGSPPPIRSPCQDLDKSFLFSRPHLIKEGTCSQQSEVSKVFKTSVFFSPHFPLPQVQSWIKDIVVMHSYKTPLSYYFYFFLCSHDLTAMSLPTQASSLIAKAGL